MPPSDLILPTGELVIVAVVGLIMFRALTLRKALVDPPYRARAFWTGIGAFSLVLLVLATIVDQITAPGTGIATNWVALLEQDVVWGAFFVALYGWIVNNINVALKADFFHRDAFYWNSGGRIVAAAMIFGAYTLASLPFWLIPPGPLSFIGPLVFTALAGGGIVYSGLILALGYFRIRDSRIKTYTKWVVLSLGSFLLLVLLPSDPYSISLLVSAFLMLFCLSRAVGSLSIRTHRMDLGEGLTSTPTGSPSLGSPAVQP